MKIKINTSGKLPSDDTIGKHKDFKKLKANYDSAVKPLYKTPLYKDYRAFIVILAIALLVYILVEIYDKENKDNKDLPKNEIKK